MHDDEFGGLFRDLRQTGAVLSRRDALRVALSSTGLYLLACANNVVQNSACPFIPAETAGPFPGDGSNGPNVLNQTGVVRSDIRSSFAGLTGTAAGIPLALTLTLVSGSADCAPLAGYAVYLWHCDREGRYSLYSAGATDQNYLRGVQASDADGHLTFSTVFPGCYAGRWPHMHFEVYPSLAAATTASSRLATSQLAFPQVDCAAVYATPGYEASVTNLAGVSLASDGIFRDGVGLQMATMAGDVGSGYTAELRVSV